MRGRFHDDDRVFCSNLTGPTRDRGGGDTAIIERMLRNMFVGEPEGTTDRVLDFSTATTGSLFFVPTAAFLDDDHPAAAR